jgi:hypothetical protein
MEAIEAVSRGRVRLASGFVLFAGAFGAVLAATTGFLLMRADGVEGSRVDRHLIGGISVAVIAVVAVVSQAWLAQRSRVGSRAGYRVVLAALCGALVLTGHDGSALTHGEEYLTEHLPWKTREAVVSAPKFPTERPVEQWAAYQHVVAPILETRCVACHNSTNFKGKLVMDRWEGLTRGGKTGPLWVAGKPEESLLVERLLLPLEDEKHMPPKKKLQLSADEISLLKLWVRAGAPAEGTPPMLASDQAWLTAAKKLPNLLIAAHNLQGVSAEESHEFDPKKVAEARVPVEAALTPLRTRFPGVISYHSRESTELRVNASLLGSAFGDADLAALAPLHGWVTELDLSDTAITDASASVLATMTQLRTLRLNGTKVGDGTLTALLSLTSLESIGLFGTDVSDTGKRSLTKLPKLRRIYAEENKVSVGSGVQLTF